MLHRASSRGGAGRAGHGLTVQSGFTLVELLVVIAIIGVLVALLLPAIQAAREASRRAQCQNQLKQIGLSIQNHIDALKVFPTGGDGYNPNIRNYLSGAPGTGVGTPLGPNKMGLGWGYQILPYLEQGALKNVTNMGLLASADIRLYFCPSRRPQGKSRVFSQAVNGITLPYLLTDYAAPHPATYVSPQTSANAGVKYTPLPWSDAGMPANFARIRDSFMYGRGNNGVSEPLNDFVSDGLIVRTPWRWRVRTVPTGVSMAVKPGECSDGLSNTMLVSEKYLRPDLYDGGSWSDDLGWADGWDPDQLRSTALQPLNDNDSMCYGTRQAWCGGPDGNQDVFLFGSAHPNGLNSVFADGSVHAMSYDIDVVLFNNLGARATTNRSSIYQSSNVHQVDWATFPRALRGVRAIPAARASFCSVRLNDSARRRDMLEPSRNGSKVRARPTGVSNLTCKNAVPTWTAPIEERRMLLLFEEHRSRSDLRASDAIGSAPQRGSIPSRLAFTLVELLVVIAIIGVLVALLLPAVQAARESARRAACLNNLRQIGIAVQNYADSHHGELPPGGITNGLCCGTPSGTSWTIEILPHLEATSLFARYDFKEINEARTDANADGKDNSWFRKQFVAVYVCPSDLDTNVFVSPSSGPGAGLEWARGSYRGVTGRSTGNPADDLHWDAHASVKRFPQYMGALPTLAIRSQLSPAALSGTLGNTLLFERVTFGRITDGTSNTLLVGERHSVGEAGQCSDPLLDSVRRQTLWAYSYTSYKKSEVTPTSGTILPDVCRCAITTGDGEACKRGWGSLHPGGLHFGNCDGSTRFVSENVDMQLLADLATIAGDEVANSAY